MTHGDANMCNQREYDTIEGCELKLNGDVEGCVKFIRQLLAYKQEPFSFYWRNESHFPRLGLDSHLYCGMWHIYR